MLFVRARKNSVRLSGTASEGGGGGGGGGIENGVIVVGAVDAGPGATASTDDELAGSGISCTGYGRMLR